MTIKDIEKLKGVHEEGCIGIPCTCKKKKSNVLQFPVKEPELKIKYKDRKEGIGVDGMLKEMIDAKLDIAMVVGYKGNDLVFACTASKGKDSDAKFLMRKAVELLLKL